MKTIRLGTRPSALAMWQANWTRDALNKLGVDVEIVKIVTSGDVNRAAAIANLGAQGVFTKEIQRALLNGEIDVAAHSLKDLPVEKIPGLKLAAVPAREDPRDVFVSNRFASLDELPQGAKIGTSSMRRKSMLLQYGAKRFPDAEGDAWDVRDIRGNVETRLKKLDDGEFDALVLASAGLKRLGFESRIRRFLEKPDFLPAVGQGALGLETREDDLETVETLEKISDSAAMLSVLAERALLAELQGAVSFRSARRARSFRPTGKSKFSRSTRRFFLSTENARSKRLLFRFSIPVNIRRSSLSKRKRSSPKFSAAAAPKCLWSKAPPIWSTRSGAFATNATKSSANGRPRINKIISLHNLTNINRQKEKTNAFNDAF